MDTDELPIANGTLEPGSSPVPCGEGASSCKWDESAHLPLVAPLRTFWIHISAVGAPLPVVLCCSVQFQAGFHGNIWLNIPSQGMSRLALGKTPCAPVVVT